MCEAAQNTNVDLFSRADQTKNRIIYQHVVDPNYTRYSYEWYSFIEIDH